MAFQQKEWKNRLSEHPTRRLLTPTDGSDAFEVDVTREEGTIMQQGDPFSATNMNDLEQRIADGIGGGDENMAPIEEGPESENAYAVGQLLIYGGQLYRVISAIAIGNTLVEDVNIEATTISNEFVGELTANGNRLYMDYKNGKYGVNTSPTRGADTFIPFNDGKVYVYGATNGNTTFQSPVSGQIYCYLMSCAAQIQWYQEDTSVSITNRVLKNGAVICDCSGSQHDSDRDAWVQLSNSYQGTVSEGDTIQVQMSGGGNYMGRASQVVIIVDGSILSPQ